MVGNVALASPLLAVALQRSATQPGPRSRSTLNKPENCAAVLAVATTHGELAPELVSFPWILTHLSMTVCFSSSKCEAVWVKVCALLFHYHFKGQMMIAVCKESAALSFVLCLWLWDSTPVWSYVAPLTPTSPFHGAGGWMVAA